MRRARRRSPAPSRVHGCVRPRQAHAEPAMRNRCGSIGRSTDRRLRAPTEYLECGVRMAPPAGVPMSQRPSRPPPDGSTFFRVSANGGAGSVDRFSLAEPSTWPAASGISPPCAPSVGAPIKRRRPPLPRSNYSLRPPRVGAPIKRRRSFETMRCRRPVIDAESRASVLSVPEPRALLRSSAASAWRSGDAKPVRLDRALE